MIKKLCTLLSFSKILHYLLRTCFERFGLFLKKLGRWDFKWQGLSWHQITSLVIFTIFLLRTHEVPVPALWTKCRKGKTTLAFVCVYKSYFALYGSLCNFLAIWGIWLQDTNIIVAIIGFLFHQDFRLLEERRQRLFELIQRNPPDK